MWTEEGGRNLKRRGEKGANIFLSAREKGRRREEVSKKLPSLQEMLRESTSSSSPERSVGGGRNGRKAPSSLREGRRREKQA